MRQTELPTKFLEAMKALLGEEFNEYLESFDREPVSGLRVHTGKASADMLPYPLTPVPWVPGGYYYQGDKRLSKDPYYYAGLYYLQEPSAMTPAALLPIEPGDMVLDLCGAPGGKSTQLGVKLQGKGMLVSNDVSSSRAKALLKNLELFGIPNICVTSETPDRLSEVFFQFFDKILVDAPCSGEGMFRRDPDMVKSWLERGPEYYCKLQKEILLQAVSMLKPGGILLYSTCTFARMEDEAVVESMLEDNPELKLLELPLFEGACDGIGLHGCIRLFPHKIQGEGHFVAMVQKGETKTKGQQAALSGLPLRPDTRASRLAAQSFDRAPLEAFLEMTAISFERERFLYKNDCVYYLPEGFPSQASLRYLRTGLLLGELKKGRFEPSQALAMVLNDKTFSVSISFSREDERIVRYLKGETISLSEGEGPVNGWCLVCVDGFGLGFAKGMGMTLKNKYYPGWRWQ